MINNYRPTWIEVNLDHLWYNYSYYQTLLVNKTVIPVIKANAYGHGGQVVFDYLYTKNIRFFAVSLLEEALELKSVHPDVDILMMGAILEEQLDLCHLHDIIITIYDQPSYDAVIAYQKHLRCHLKIDTGMHRYGIDDLILAKEMVDQLFEHKKISFEGIYTHFATASDDQIFYQEQMKRFETFLGTLKRLPKVIHASNSSSMSKLEIENRFMTHTRLGISLYGLSLEMSYPPIKPVLSLKSKFVAIKVLKKGECLGYGQTYCADKDEIVGLLSIGYADGWIRKNKFGYVDINAEKYQIIGNICMDTTFIKIDDTIKKGDLVTLIGGIIHIDEVARRLQTINYEIITNLTYRIPRFYIKDGHSYDKCTF